MWPDRGFVRLARPTEEGEGGSGVPPSPPRLDERLVDQLVQARPDRPRARWPQLGEEAGGDPLPRVDPERRARRPTPAKLAPAAAHLRPRWLHTSSRNRGSLQPLGASACDFAPRPSGLPTRASGPQGPPAPSRPTLTKLPAATTKRRPGAPKPRDRSGPENGMAKLIRGDIVVNLGNDSAVAALFCDPRRTSF